MKNNLSKMNFDVLFKVILLGFIAYFLYLVTLISIQMKNNAGVGRYQFKNDAQFILDTKTGEVKRFRTPAFQD